MGLLGKIMCMVACAVGVVCTLAPIIVEGDHIRREFEPYSMHIFDRCSPFEYRSIRQIFYYKADEHHHPLYDNILSFTPPTVFFTICAYALAKNANDVSLLDKPNTPEWLFGSIISSVCVILCSLTLATSSV
ncbi:hypothetical protein FBUS_08782 [Fasciolopsis buskii]|uniref:Uncharacterized protein n=1 Tax=Fasciolopsis buskii TaxID=27845 RepID=A0A8E0VH03_9TREM|nr:hypothetical protein FBUS_08782 [Fasciolopsis buski]